MANMAYDPEQAAEKYRLAQQTAAKSQPDGGCFGFEFEWNLLDSHFRPLLTIGSGPNQQSFVDYLRTECLSPWMRNFSQLEVFHWMIEWATRPYYTPRMAVHEGRLMEAVLLNALDRAGRYFNEKLYTWPGNLPKLTAVGHDSIPSSWHLAKRLYLQRCVDLYGSSLATAGTHTNLSLPDPLFAWDFMHLPPSERMMPGNITLHLDDYRSAFYITAARLMRAFTSMFIACSAATPFRSQIVDGRSVVILSQFDSVRNLTFPNPAEIDLPDLYRSYDDYLKLSFDLVDRGVRFGNNNWTPVRARSFAEPVERLIAVTSDQLNDLYARGLYALGQEVQMDEMAHQIELQNLKARINLPMARVEVRTDDGGHPLEVDIANLTLKQLLLVRFYADPDFGRAFRYDREDIQRARRNEEQAAKYGLRADIEHPLSAKPLEMREFLRWTLAEVQPLAVALGAWQDLQPLVEMAAGEVNTAERLRLRVQGMLGQTVDEEVEVPLEILVALAEERQSQVSAEVGVIAASHSLRMDDDTRMSEFLQRAREEAHTDLQAPIRFRPTMESLIERVYPDKTGEILELSQELIRIPSVTACPDERLDEVRRAGIFLFDYVRNYGMGVRYFGHDRYPALLVGLPENMHAPVMLCGHFDVVEPDPDDSQFSPRIEGDYLWGRGTADMKTVVATYLVWMKDAFRKGPPYPPVNLLLVGNEENGETEPMGTPHVLRLLQEEGGYAPEILIAGERTGEGGDELWGEICTQNRGVMRFEVIARGLRQHTGIAPTQGQRPGSATPLSDLTERLLLARAAITGIFGQTLTLSSPDGWQSSAKFPFIQIGTPGVYNIAASYGVLGAEVRPIPQDELQVLHRELQAFCTSLDLELKTPVMENGITCSPDNRWLAELTEAVGQVSGRSAQLGRKLPGTSARFAPGGQGVVWGQSGIGPHTKDERHFIPSILPYYRALEAYANRLRALPAW